MHDFDHTARYYNHTRKQVLLADLRGLHGSAARHQYNPALRCVGHAFADLRFQLQHVQTGTVGDDLNVNIVLADIFLQVASTINLTLSQI